MLLPQKNGSSATGQAIEAVSKVEWTRRKFMVVGLGNLVMLSACSAEPQTTVSQSEQAAHPRTIDEFISTKPFYIAHRGSGDNWVEHTLDSYTESIRAGASAIEVSVRATSDGVLICHHDANLKRTTGTDKLIAESTWAEVSKIYNNAQTWLGPNSAEQPISMLKDVLDKFATEYVIFIEDKDGSNTHQLLDLLDRYPDSKSHFVWKQWAGSKPGRIAKERGYRRWGYFTDDLLARASELESEFDYLGVNSSLTDAQMRQFVAYGKPVICWEVHFRSQRDQLEELGVAGMMCSNIPYVTTSKPISSTDSFATGLRPAGDLPWIADKGWGYQPKIDPYNASLLFNGLLSCYLMGSMCPVESASYRLNFEMRWPRDTPGWERSGGIALGMENDGSYVLGAPSKTSGYHLLLKGSGQLEFYRRQAGETTGKLLGSVLTRRPEIGQWVSFTITVQPGQVTVVRDGDTSSVITVQNLEAWGGYFALLKSYNQGAELEYRGISVLDSLK